MKEAKLAQEPDVNLFTKHVVLVELDALMDTRLGTLHTLNPEYAIEAVQSLDYYNRISDDLSHCCAVTDAEYRAAYAVRDAEVLQSSRMTNLIFMLSNICVELDRQRRETPFTESVKVHLNVYPYQLDDSERFAIESALMCHLPMDVQVESVSIAPSALTPQYINSQYTGMLLYNFIDWIQRHYATFEHFRMAGVTILAPRLHAEHGAAFTAADLGPDVTDLDPYDMIAQSHAMFFGLEWLSPVHYCMITDTSLNDVQNELQRVPMVTTPTQAPTPPESL